MCYVLHTPSFGQVGGYAFVHEGASRQAKRMKNNYEKQLFTFYREHRTHFP